MRRYIGPFLLAGCAALLSLSTLFQPPLFQDLGPISLQQDATRSVTFRADYTGHHEVGLKMDQAVAESLAPCWTDPMHMSSAPCRGVVMPTAFGLRLFEKGRDLTPSIDVDTADAGGTYDGTEGYTWLIASLPLEKGHLYTLVLRSSGKGAVLAPARPRLILGGPITAEDRGVLFLLRFLSAGLLALVGLVWLIAIWLRRP